MLPITPHLASECLSEVGSNKNLDWPEVQHKYLKAKEYKIVVQINAKKRALFSTKIDMKEDDLIEEIKKLKEINKFIFDKKIIKSIYIKNKLINLIVK